MTGTNTPHSTRSAPVPPHGPTIIIGAVQPGSAVEHGARTIAIPEHFNLENFNAAIRLIDEKLGNKADLLVEMFVSRLRYWFGAKDNLGTCMEILPQMRNSILSGIPSEPNSGNFLGIADTLRMNIKREINALNWARIRRDESDLPRLGSNKERLRQIEEGKKKYAALSGMLEIVDEAERILINQFHIRELSNFIDTIPYEGSDRILELGRHIYEMQSSLVPALLWATSEARARLRYADAGDMEPPSKRPPWVSPDVQIYTVDAAALKNIQAIIRPFVAVNSKIIVAPGPEHYTDA